MQQSFKTKVREKLVQAAGNYAKLLDKEIILASDSFENTNLYIIRFFKSNFLHLTGVYTNLATEEFFEKCFDGSISENDFNIEVTPEQKGLVRLKMKHLPFINSFFETGLLVQENFQKGSINCLVATSDGKCTIGFVDAKYHVRPKTILDKNHLQKDKRIIKINPVIKSL